MTLHQEAHGIESQLHHAKCSVQCSRGGSLGWLQTGPLACSAHLGCSWRKQRVVASFIFLQTVASLEQVGIGRCVVLLECSG